MSDLLERARELRTAMIRRYGDGLQHLASLDLRLVIDQLAPECGLAFADQLGADPGDKRVWVSTIMTMWGGMVGPPTTDEPTSLTATLNADRVHFPEAWEPGGRGSFMAHGGRLNRLVLLGLPLRSDDPPADRFPPRLVDWRRQLTAKNPQEEGDHDVRAEDEGAA